MPGGSCNLAGLHMHSHGPLYGIWWAGIWKTASFAVFSDTTRLSSTLLLALDGDWKKWATGYSCMGVIGFAHSRMIKFLKTKDLWIIFIIFARQRFFGKYDGINIHNDETFSTNRYHPFPVPLHGV